MYIIASLILSDLLGIPGLIYANCLNMSIRIVSSLYFGLLLEKSPKAAFYSFLKDIRTVDLSFAIDMVKRVVKRKRD